MIINHFDEVTGRFLALEVDDKQVLKKRAEAGETERLGLKRDQVLRRCLRLLDAGAASPEQMLGEAFNAGHLIGSKVAHITNAEMLVIETLHDLTDDALVVLCRHFPQALPFAGALRVLRKQAGYAEE